MLDFFQKLADPKFIPDRQTLRELQLEMERGRKAEAELQASHEALEKQISLHVADLARTNSLLQDKARENEEVNATVSAIGESMPFGVWIYEKTGKVRFISKSLLELMDCDLENATTKNWWDLLPENARAAAEAAWTRCMGTNCSWDFEFVLPKRDGTFHTIMSRGVPVKNSTGKILYYAGVQLDVSERVRIAGELKAAHENLETQIQQRTVQLNAANHQLTLDLVDRMKAEEALRASETQLRAMFDNSLDGIVVLDDSRRILDANPSALALFGITRDALNEYTLDRFIAATSKEQFLRDWPSLTAESEHWGELDVMRADGSMRLVQFSSKANFVPGRHLANFRDITRRREAEESLSFLSQRLLQAQDEERRRIARELHDSTGQCLAAVRMNLQILKGEEDRLSENARKSLDDAFNTSSSCAADVRTLSYLLHPPLLDELGLVAALGWYTSGFAERSGVHVTLDVSPRDLQLPQDVGTALYRIVQECLTNIHRHSHSPSALIRLALANNQIVLNVSDQGRGLPTDKREILDDGVKGLGVGIGGMRERVKQLGGTLKIMPENPGTTVIVTLPWEADYASTQAPRS
jgi:two-component system, NarL family, sensor kinase